MHACMAIMCESMGLVVSLGSVVWCSVVIMVCHAVQHAIFVLQATGRPICVLPRMFAAALG